MRRRLNLAVLLLALAAAAVPLGVAPSGAAPPVGLGADVKVQPGGEVRIDGGGCTLNYLFQGSDGHRYIGSAGHCVLGDGPVSSPDDAPLEMTWAPGGGPTAENADGERIGEFAYAVLANPKDFSLIRLDEDVEASPQMAHFGGPTGLNDDITSEPVGIEFYGHGIVLGSVFGAPTLPGRSGFAFSLPDPDRAYTSAPSAPGDSGAAVNTADGRALGVLVAGGLALGDLGPDGIDAGFVVITRLAPQIARAAEKTGITFTLLTAPKL